MRLPRLALTSLVALGALTAAPDVASACTTAVEYDVAVEQSDLPECATLIAGPSVGEAIIVFENDCGGELTIDALDCASCQERMTLRPGAENREFVVEGRDEPSMPQLSWSMDGMSGEILLDVGIVNGDEESSCGGGCRLGATPGPGSGAGLLGLLLGLGLGLRSTRRRRR